MGNLSGFAAAKARLEQAKAEQAERRAKSSAGYLRVEVGVEKFIRPICDFDKEPYIFKSHFVKRLNRGFVCSEQPDCVGCTEREAGDKGISLSPRAAISVWDYTVLHKVPKKGKKDEHDYEICTATADDPECKWCDRKIEAKMVGKRYWEMSMTTLETLLTNQRKISERCRSCGTGKIKHVEWCCEKCEELLDVGAEEVRVKCKSCGYNGAPKEVVSCTKCKKPERATINDCDWSIIRSGDNTSTSYVLTPEPFSDLPDDIFKKPEDSEPIDFATVLAPPSHKEMAKMLGLDFSGHRDSRGARGYDDDEPEAASEGGDDDTPAETPRAGRRGSPRAPARGSSSGGRLRIGGSGSRGREDRGEDDGGSGRGHIPW